MWGGGGAVGRLVGQAVEARQQPKTQGLRCNFVSLSLAFSLYISLPHPQYFSLYVSLPYSQSFSLFFILFFE